MGLPFAQMAITPSMGPLQMPTRQVSSRSMESGAAALPKGPPPPPLVRFWSILLPLTQSSVPATRSVPSTCLMSAP